MADTLAPHKCLLRLLESRNFKAYAWIELHKEKGLKYHLNHIDVMQRRLVRAFHIGVGVSDSWSHVMHGKHDRTDIDDGIANVMSAACMRHVRLATGNDMHVCVRTGTHSCARARSE